MINVEIIRGNQTESIHKVKSLVINSKNKVIFSTNNDSDYIYPRSAIKIFQAIPLIYSGAADFYNINEKQISLSSSSHFAENKHVHYLEKWLKIINIRETNLKCGIHNPLDLDSSNKLLLSGKKSSQIYNNCSGKHLGMITTAKYKNYNISDYTNFSHPIQKTILSVLQKFTEFDACKSFKAVDGCGAPQYAFPIESLALAMSKLSCFDQLELKISLSLHKLLYCIIKYPFFIGGTNRFDSEIITVTKGRIFCKLGAEGVLLFADMKKKYGGVLKVEDGNNRAIPSAAISLLKKLKSISSSEERKLKKWNPELIYNFSKTKTGFIKCNKL
ncbi:MAG: hypothetical protein CFH21_00665 [Alphaproteobacteria bacterium MarineAlpha5_Bin11]|nr:hypothetical protein [Pelagibacteraceae bacterium]PPR43799.1 MAG: hypothetical protein CFH21_00665 [Alphaproteobacteria bacterium MarineAlpha5_Bin11]|tara:strand:- start:30802 stop:31791 length:990 start_codon:yes stop_codon:yes gene_type:complete